MPDYSAYLDTLQPDTWFADSVDPYEDDKYASIFGPVSKYFQATVKGMTLPPPRTDDPAVLAKQRQLADIAKRGDINLAPNPDLQVDLTRHPVPPKTVITGQQVDAARNDHPAAAKKLDALEVETGPLPDEIRQRVIERFSIGSSLDDMRTFVGQIHEQMRVAVPDRSPDKPQPLFGSSIGAASAPDYSHYLDSLSPSPNYSEYLDQLRPDNDFSDVTGSASSTADDRLRKKREQMAQARQLAAAQGLAGPAPAQGVGDRVVAVGDRVVSAGGDALASIPELAGKAVEQFLPTGVSYAPDATVYPTIGKPGGFLDMAADRQRIHQQALDARERLLGSQGDPGVIAGVDTLAEAAGMAVPIPGLHAARAAEEIPALARAAGLAEGVSPEAADEAAYMARRAKVMPTIPGVKEPLVGPGALADAIRPEAKILQVGAHADDAAQDLALGLRARPQDAGDAAELARVSQAIDETAAPSLPRQAPPSLAEIFGDPVHETIDPVHGTMPAVHETAPPVHLTPEPPPPAAAVPTLRNLLTREEVPLDTPYTGTKNVVTEGERITRGLPEVEAIARKSTGDTWAEARQTFEADPEAPRLLAARIAEKPRTLTPVENDLLLHDRMKMSLDHRESLAAESTALDAGDQEAAAMAKMRRQSIEQAMDVNDTALKRAGTEWSAGGLARQKLIAEDYSPLYLRQRLTVAARESGAAEVPGAADRLTEISRQLEEAQQQIATFEDRLSQGHAERSVAAVEKDVAAADRAGVRRAARQTLDAEYQDLAAQLEVKARKNQSTVNMSGGLDPETVGIIGKMAKNRVQAGARGLGEVVDGIFQTVRPHIEGLEPSEVRDAISGYGVVRQQATHSEAVAELAKIRQQGRLVSKLEALQAGEALPKGTPRAAPAPEVAALQEKLRQVTRDLDANPLRSDAQRLAAMKTRLEKRISDAERGLAPRAARAPLADTAETAALRKKLAQVMDEHGLAPDPEAQRLAALKTRLTNRAAELEKHIAEGYIPKKVRRPVALDKDAIALQGRVNGLKRQADLIIRKQELAGRTGAEKALDYTQGWGRFLKLTGVSTLQKISSAAAERALVFRPIEELIGGVLSKAPLVRDIAREARIEGGGSFKAAVAKGYAGFFGKAAREELRAHLGGAEGPMELALGKAHLGGETPEWMSYPGHIHAGLKAPAKISGYEYAMEKQAQHYLGLGQAEKLHDPVAIAEMKARAWEFANRDIFMGDNAAVNAFRRAFAHQEGDSLAARAGKTTANVLMPIVKVPTNYALEATDYLAGLPKAALRTGNVVRRGLKATAEAESRTLADVVHAGLQTLPEGQADLIMRQLKKGALGAGLISLGATGAVEVGGYYDGKRKAGELQPGQIRIAGHAVPHMILHHPALEALQVGGSIYRAKTVPEGLGTAGKGLAENIPFIETPVMLARDLWGREPTKAVGGLARGMTLPPDAQRLARVLDQKHPTSLGEKILQQLGWQDIEAKKRKPRGDFVHKMLKEEELGIPWLRDNVR